jgi:hypothetical protein
LWEAEAIHTKNKAHEGLLKIFPSRNESGRSSVGTATKSGIDRATHLAHDFEVTEPSGFDFKNFKELWEDEAIHTKNKAHEGLLNEKYKYIILFDKEENEIRRAVYVEWITTRPSRYAVITKLVVGLKKGVQANDNDDDANLVSYYIDDALFACIRAAPWPYNHERTLLDESTTLCPAVSPKRRV